MQCGRFGISKRDSATLFLLFSFLEKLLDLNELVAKVSGETNVKAATYVADADSGWSLTGGSTVVSSSK